MYEPPMFDVNIEKNNMQAEIDRLRSSNVDQAAEIERLLDLVRGIGASRYWEGRWRDEKVENEKLRSALQKIDRLDAREGHVAAFTAAKNIATNVLPAVEQTAGGSKMTHPMAEPWLDWRPIETAPRDGTKILIWCPSDDDGETYKVAHWGPDPHGSGWSYRGGWMAFDEPDAWASIPHPPERLGRR